MGILDRPSLRTLILAGAAFGMLAAAPAMAQQTDGKTGQRLDAVKRALKQDQKKQQALKRKAAEIEKDMTAARQKRIAAAQAIQEQERRVTELELSLRNLATQRQGKSVQMKARRAQYGRVLMAMQKLARFPPEALLVQPLGPSDTVRSAILLRSVVPGIEQTADAIRRDLDGLTMTRRMVEAKRQQLVSAAEGLKTERNRLNALLVDKALLKARAQAQRQKVARRMKGLSREAKSLRDLLRRLREQKDEANKRAARNAPKELSKDKTKTKSNTKTAVAGPVVGGRVVSKARGAMFYPAAGRVIGLYGQATETGLTRKGIVIETRPGGQVVAPYDGQVVFSGPFRGYGQLLIIEHSEGYHTLLAGLSKLDGSIGQKVVAGEPIGVMGRPDAGKPALYVELRRRGQPINPLPWLAARKSKVNG